MKNIQLLYIFIGLFLFSCSEDEYISNERSILSVKSDGQIGLAVVPAPTEKKDTVYIVVSDDVDLTKFAPSVAISPGALIEPASGTPVNIQSSKNIQKYVVTSESGESRTWYLKVKVFVNPLVGTWKIKDFSFYWDDWYGWGNAGRDEIVKFLPEVAPGLDDILVMGKIEKLNSDGSITGSYERKAGADGKYATYVSDKGNDWSSRLYKFPDGKGKWTIAADGSASVTAQAGTKFPFKKIEQVSPTIIKIYANPGPQAWDHDWGNYKTNPYNKFISTVDVWLTLEKQ